MAYFFSKRLVVSWPCRFHRFSVPFKGSKRGEGGRETKARKATGLEAMKGIYCYSVVLVLFLAAAAAAAALPTEAVVSADFRNISISSLQWHAVDDEFAMESETSRRILQGGDHISYSVLNADRPAGGPATSGLAYTPGCHRNQYYRCD